MDSAEVWDQIVASAQTKISSRPSQPKPFGLARLLLRQEQTVTALPHIRRCVAEIDPGVRQAIRRVVSGESPWPLFLHGPAGCGKTCAGLCMLDHCSGKYFTVADLSAKLIDAEQGRLEVGNGVDFRKLWLGEVWEYFRQLGLVVMDELATKEHVSDHHYEAVKHMLDQRYGMPLVCISNLGPEAIAKVYDDRILSRLAAGTVVALEGKDRRISQ